MFQTNVLGLITLTQILVKGPSLPSPRFAAGGLYRTSLIDSELTVSVYTRRVQEAQQGPVSPIFQTGPLSGGLTLIRSRSIINLGSIAGLGESVPCLERISLSCQDRGGAAFLDALVESCNGLLEGTGR